jgi:hypothetical protein
MKESGIWKEVLLAVHRVKGVRLMRNNVAMAWVGKCRRLKPGEAYRAAGGEMVLFNPRPLHAGLMKGSGDGIGWQTITITPEMVGTQIAQFLSVETKTSVGDVETDQATWDRNVKKAGGISIIARSGGEAVEGLNQLSLLS